VTAALKVNSELDAHKNLNTDIRKKEVMEIKQPISTPTSGPHPEDIDPLGKMHSHQTPAEEKKAHFILAVSLVTGAALILIITALSGAPLVNVLLGLSPFIITLLLDILATKHHYKAAAYWIILVIVHLLAFAVLYFVNFLLTTQLNVNSAVSSSLILGMITTAFLTLAAGKLGLPEQKKKFEPDRIQEYVQSIEDKCKAINFVVGRVYRNSNGGNPKLRERLRIPSEWYNEFSATGEAKENTLAKAKVMVRKIRDRLSLYSQKEREVFHADEVKHLKHLHRNAAGEDTVITVLHHNDSDPVEQYYKSAMEFCDTILAALEK
jgi:hypothetical protein